MLTCISRSQRIAIAALFFVSLSACVERKEHLKISPSGLVMHQVKHASDSLEDLYDGDAVPREAGGWLVTQEEEQDAEGKSSYRLIAEAAFAPAAELPSNYALKKDPDADLYLQFPTMLVIESRADGDYYHFARTYPARQWAQIALLEERLVEIPLSDLQGLSPRDWTKDQRIVIVQSLANFETEKLLYFAREAFTHATPDAPQDVWLAVREHMHGCLSSMNYSELAELLIPKDHQTEEEQLQQSIEAETKLFGERSKENLKDALRTLAHYQGSQVDYFMTEFDRRLRAYQITQDLTDEKFEIKVEMPGGIIASNADSISGSTAVWEFDGQVIRDREIELLVTSRIPR